MRLHTDKITTNDIQVATRRLPDVYATAREHGSRSHARAFDVKLTGTNTARTNDGTGDYAATWDEWGVFMARLYEIDPNAMWGKIYHTADDFHTKTQYRFEDGVMPEDTHKRHRWLGLSHRVFQCAKCSAVWDQS